jgi:hypothetical protein
MFSYNPGVYDQSGQILADSMTQAAATQAQMYNDLGKNIGSGVKKAASAAIGFATGGPAGAAMAVQGANEEGGSFLDTIVSSYAKKEQDKSDSKIYGNLMKIVAPAFGKDGDSILEQWNSLESDRDRAQFGGTLFSSLGQISNMYMANRNAGIREQGQALTARMPNLRKQADAQAQVAAGQGRMAQMPPNINLSVIP